VTGVLLAELALLASILVMYTLSFHSDALSASVSLSCKKEA
jgi:hypothetical protein